MRNGKEKLVFQKIKLSHASDLKRTPAMKNKPKVGKIKPSVAFIANGTLLKCVNVWDRLYRY